ncbi:uncharacterized protein ATNIH1004_002324 [Aspergillus tanneri]|uniref:Uncharacterized protein n=1 Tax=Aspergillus tanneri TaxID=1220188 RepID=A0A5M9MXL8_9EURO|nr:uncharacterized protein ATNIH1004_002324 [Aspergillus tanneri]KAA8649653.1 hypothetical protein ATNIH1004_002324 [Aspergillus tanneri]
MRGAPKLGLKPYGAIGALLTTQNQENLDIDRRVPVSVRKEKPSCSPREMQVQDGKGWASAAPFGVADGQKRCRSPHLYVLGFE